MGRGGKNRGSNKQNQQPQGGGHWVFVPAGGKKHVQGGRPMTGGRQPQVVIRNIQKPAGRKVIPSFGAQKVQTFQYTLANARKQPQKFGKVIMQKPQPKANAMDDRMKEKLAAIGSECKVWVGGLGQDYSWKKLERFFATNATKPKLTQVYPKGTACVCMKSEEEVSNAISLLNGTDLDGKTLQVDVWTQKEKTDRPKGPQSKRGKKNQAANVKQVIKTSFLKKPQAQGKAKAKAKAKGKVPLTAAEEKMKEKLAAIDNSLKVWVGGLAEDATWQKLKAHFTEGGCKPNLVNVMRKGTAVLTFDTVDEVTNAIACMNGSKVGGKGKDLEVDAWVKPERRERKKKDAEEAS